MLNGFQSVAYGVDIDEIETLRFYPLFLRKTLKNIKPFPEHVINRDD
ncbi:MAG: hypothetical protein KGD68_10165 [Candidatus Lokiarchaeota archaeon]|nr:hypothetical protein [Candidatus Lokiarchaeota archaeon]